MSNRVVVFVALAGLIAGVSSASAQTTHYKILKGDMTGELTMTRQANGAVVVKVESGVQAVSARWEE